MSRRDIGPLVGTANGRLLDKSGTVVATEDSDRDELPPYFNEDRKAGIEGDMVLALTGRPRQTEGGSRPEITFASSRRSSGEDGPSLEIQADKRKSGCRSTEFASNS
jgi:hypothetical protein